MCTECPLTEYVKACIIVCFGVVDKTCAFSQDQPRKRYTNIEKQFPF